MRFARNGIADRLTAERIGRFVDEHDAVRDQPLERRRRVVGEGADDFVIVVAVVGKTVGLDYRPVGKIAIEQFGRIDDAVFLLQTRAAAERYVSAAADAVTAEVILGLDHDHGVARFARGDCRRRARCAGPDHDDVRRMLPRQRQSRLCIGGGRSSELRAGQRGCGKAAASK